MWATAGSSLCVVAALVASAAAQAPSDADVAFKNGRELLKAGKFADACREFENSQALDPQLGTQFNIAQCDEKIGKVASALAIYRDLVANDANAKRKATATALVTQLVGQVPKLVVNVAGAAHSTITLSGGDAGARSVEPNQAIELDFGDYTIVVHADGMTDYTGKVAIHELARTTTLAVVLAPVSREPSAPTAPRANTTGTTTPTNPTGTTTTASTTTTATDQPEPTSEPALWHRKVYGYAAIAVGGAAIVGSVVVGELASSKWNAAKTACGGGMTCTTSAELADANSLRDQANTRASIATALAIAGGVVAAGGVAWWLTAPSERAVAVTPSVGSGGAELVVSGRF